MKNVTLDADGRLFIDGEHLPTIIPPEEDIDFLDAWELEERAMFLEQYNAFKKQIAQTPEQEDKPDPQWLRGKCPDCGGDLVSNLYYVGGKGYLVFWECWDSLGDDPTCEYSRVI